MRLAYVVNGICGSGGLERTLSIRTRYLIQTYQYEIHILVLYENEMERFFDFHEGVKFHFVYRDKRVLFELIQNRIRAKKTLKEIDPAIISICDDGLKGLFFPRIYGKLKPMIYERHASKQFFFRNKSKGLRKERRYDRWFNLGAKDFDAFVVLSRGSAKEWNANNIKIIPNPLSFPITRRANHSGKRIIAVGNHSYNKGYDRLLNIWKIVSEKYPDWHLAIFGNALDGRVNETCKQMGLEASVRFYDPVQDIKVQYERSAICVMTSRSEGFGMVLIEAMSCGIPCVAFDCPVGPAEIITDGEDGFLVPDGNAQLFANRLCQLMENRKLRESLGNKAQDSIEQYRVDRIGNQWNALYSELKDRT